MEAHSDAANIYTLIITRRNGSEILLCSKGVPSKLPRVAIRPRQRIALELTRALAESLGLQTCCLFVRSVPRPTQTGDTGCAVMETLRHNENAPLGTDWTPQASAYRSLDPDDAGNLHELLREMDAYVSGQKAGPFARPGWLRELSVWARGRLAPLGVRLTGGFRQLNASPTFSLIRLETNQGAVWFKATGEPNSHELPATLWLAKFFSCFVPQVLGVHRAWNGWLAAEAFGVPLDESTGDAPWEHAAETLAELQIASIGRVSDLLKARLKDLRLPALVARIDPFLAAMRPLMDAQDKRVPPPLSSGELQALAADLRDACAIHRSLGLPDTLGHIDFNPGNIIVSEDRCLFLDWAEGCVANPLVTFEYLSEHLSRIIPKLQLTRKRLASAYLRPWMSLSSPEVVGRALGVSPLLAVFTYAVSGDRWRSSDLVHDSILAGFFRGLTRRMYHEAAQAATGRKACAD
jgi:hypothetical protein